MFKNKKVLFICRFIRTTRTRYNWIQIITEDGSLYKYDLPKESCYSDPYYIDFDPPNIDDIKPEAMLDEEEILKAFYLSQDIENFSFKTKNTAKDAGNKYLFVERNGNFEIMAKNGNSSGGVGGATARKIYAILAKNNFFEPRLITNE